MKRGISLFAVAGLSSALAVGAGGALASAKTATAAKTVKLRCRVTLIQQPPNGQDAILPGADSGQHYGRVKCPHGLGQGVIHDSFKVPDSGDTVAKYTMYFKAGGFSGTFDLTPGQGQQLSGNSFQSESWAGTMTVSGGSGAYKRIQLAKKKAKKGTLSCTSPDTVHLKCKATISVVL